MATIAEIIAQAVSAAMTDLYKATVAVSDVQVQKINPQFEGHLTVVAFALTRAAGKPPHLVAEELGTFLKENCKEVSDYNVVKGFLNLSIIPSFWMDAFSEIWPDPAFGHAAANSKEQIMVEYSSPNTNKPLHLGHMRNIFLGYSLANILKANGNKVVKVQIINDRGIHICKSMVAWKHFGEGETPESSGMKGDKLAGKYYVLFDKTYKAQAAELLANGADEKTAEAQAPIMLEARDMLQKWEAEDPEVRQLWSTMNGWVYAGFDKTYQTMGVDFDKLYYESNTYLLGKEEIEKGLESGVLFKKEDGSVWIDLTAEGLDEKLVLRADGTAVYMTQDIGTAILRYRDYPHLAAQIYTVGNEQEYHFKVLFLILEKLGFEQAKNNYHLSYGMVVLPEGKMKSREGTVVDADDIMAEMVRTAAERSEELGKLDEMAETEKEALFRVTGLGAIKYFLLRIDPRKDILFNPEESIDLNGNTAIFVQYGYVRTRALLRKFGAGLNQNSSFAVEPGQSEVALIQSLLEFPEIIEESAKSYNPATLCSYCYNLTRQFNSYYHEVPIGKEEDEAKRSMRVALAAKTGDVLASAMKLLGIEMPERM